MLYFTHRIGEDIAVHVGDNFRHNNPESVTEVQADCDELEHIRKVCVNLPFSDQRVQLWFGDHAKFIAANVKF